MNWHIVGGRVLLGDGSREEATVAVEGGTIAALGGAAGSGRRLDARGLEILPGIVDLHGDAFERQIQPRPGVPLPVGPALRDTEAQLLANGITTALHAVTLSWEPGLRSVQTWREIVDGLEASRGSVVCDMRVHMRWELHNLDALEMALDDIADGRVALVSFNDHTPATLRKLADPAAAAAYCARARTPFEAFRSLAERAFARDTEVPAASARIAAAARHAGLPMASHDDATVAARAAYRALGARICEFPMAEAVGVEARDSGDAVVMGCPNVVRGGSHLGWASAAALAERDVCTVLCSDYYYPAMMPAAWRLAGPLGLSRAWSLIAENPARAAGLEDRGVIAEGKRADLVLIDPDGPRVVATIAAGQVGYLSGAGWSRLHG